jgi:hypothetical protein
VGKHLWVESLMLMLRGVQGGGIWVTARGDWRGLHVELMLEFEAEIDREVFPLLVVKRLNLSGVGCFKLDLVRVFSAIVE